MVPPAVFCRRGRVDHERLATGTRCGENRGSYHHPQPPRAMMTDGTPPLRVLVVEPDPVAADCYAILLRLFGHLPRVAADGPAALALAHADPPDAVLLDLAVPGMDGYEVARCLRAAAGPRRPLFIALTAREAAPDLRRSAGAGIHRHLHKPVRAEVLLPLLRPPRPAAPEARRVTRGPLRPCGLAD